MTFWKRQTLGTVARPVVVRDGPVQGGLRAVMLNDITVGIPVTRLSELIQFPILAVSVKHGPGVLMRCQEEWSVVTQLIGAGRSVRGTAGGTWESEFSSHFCCILKNCSEKQYPINIWEVSNAALNPPM